MNQQTTLTKDDSRKIGALFVIACFASFGWGAMFGVTAKLLACHFVSWLG